VGNEFETEIRLESSFHPYALRQTWEFKKRQRDPTLASFVHYTSAEAALSILDTKRIWMRNVTCMPDFTEVQQGFNLINKVLFRGNQEGGKSYVRPSMIALRDAAIRPFSFSINGGPTSDITPASRLFLNTT
jgi:hypothetical protein